MVLAVYGLVASSCLVVDSHDGYEPDTEHDLMMIAALSAVIVWSLARGVGHLLHSRHEFGVYHALYSVLEAVCISWNRLGYSLPTQRTTTIGAVVLLPL